MRKRDTKYAGGLLAIKVVILYKKEKGEKKMKKRILPIVLITAAVAVLLAYKGEESEPSE